MTWPEELRMASSFTIGWSYIVAWTGIGFTLMSSLLFSGAAICIRSEFRMLRVPESLVKMYYPPIGPPPPMPPPTMNYYSAGFPAQSYDNLNDSRLGNGYKSVLKELEDAKL